MVLRGPKMDQSGPDRTKLVRIGINVGYCLTVSQYPYFGLEKTKDRAQFEIIGEKYEL